MYHFPSVKKETQPGHKMMTYFAIFTSQQFRISFIPAEVINSAANYLDDNPFTIRLIQAFINIHMADVQLPG